MYELEPTTMTAKFRRPCADSRKYGDAKARKAAACSLSGRTPGGEPPPPPRAAASPGCLDDGILCWFIDAVDDVDAVDLGVEAPPASTSMETKWDERAASESSFFLGSLRSIGSLMDTPPLRPPGLFGPGTGLMSRLIIFF